MIFKMQRSELEIYHLLLIYKKEIMLESFQVALDKKTYSNCCTCNAEQNSLSALLLLHI